MRQKTKLLFGLLCIVGCSWLLYSLAFLPAWHRLKQERILQDFAGDYRLATLFWGSELSLHSDQTFSLYEWTDIGMGFVYTGTVAVVGYEVRLNPTDPDFRMPLNLVPVEWWQRKYLIPAENITDFCYEVEQGWEPRTVSRGSFYLREEDWDKLALGIPISLTGDWLCP